MLGDAAAALQSFSAALARAPQLSEAWVGMGDIAAQRNEHGEALRCYEQALGIDPGLLVTRNNRAQSLMALGRIKEAWRDSETRFELPHAATLYPHRLALPRWDGRPGARVLVHWEQGFGDIIQHLRFLPRLADRLGPDGSCAFECPPPLAALVRRMPGAPALITAGNQAPALPGFDCQAALLSLPHLLGISDDALPQSPYLCADTARAAALRASWSQGGACPLVGIAWRASSFDTRRSVGLSVVLDAFAARVQSVAPGVRLVALQKDISTGEQSLLSQRGSIDAGAAFDSFDDSAAALAALDSVVCVDTAVAHLAGALGVQTTLLLNEPAAVRWMLGRTDTPWYASMRILRKSAEQSWSGLLAQAADMPQVAA